ncbi:superoxide dismutase [Candidatus Peregrinibacteria bacterium]|nr:superoxide dismutase [Candidatus Peregrinibacteria bacterium]
MMPYTLPPLPYSYDALEPYIDAKTMEIHHSKHHQTYVDKLNAAVSGTGFDMKSVEELLGDLNSVPENIRTAVRNHAGGVSNHTLFWNGMAPNAGGEPNGKLSDALNSTFGSFQTFRDTFTNAAVTLFGSGWAWFVIDKNGSLAITTTPNQDSPISHGAKILLGIDVWEHAYYLQYQNRRADFITAWWNTVNWKVISEMFQKSL